MTSFSLSYHQVCRNVGTFFFLNTKLWQYRSFRWCIGHEKKVIVIYCISWKKPRCACLNYTNCLLAWWVLSQLIAFNRNWWVKITFYLALVFSFIPFIVWHILNRYGERLLMILASQNLKVKLFINKTVIEIGRFTSKAVLPEVLQFSSITVITSAKKLYIGIMKK